MLPWWRMEQSTGAYYLFENINISHDGENFCDKQKNYVNSEETFPEEFLLGAAINQNKRVYL